MACATTPHTLHPTPYTPHPTPYTLHPTPYTLHPTPCTLHPTPFTLHSTPYTLHHGAMQPLRFSLEREMRGMRRHARVLRAARGRALNAR